MIDDTVRQANQIVENMRASGRNDKRVLAVAVEINQLYLEYLEEVETGPIPVHKGVYVEVDGQVIHFKDSEDFARWCAERTGSHE